MTTVRISAALAVSALAGAVLLGMGVPLLLRGVVFVVATWLALAGML